MSGIHAGENRLEREAYKTSQNAQKAEKPGFIKRAIDYIFNPVSGSVSEFKGNDNYSGTVPTIHSAFLDIERGGKGGAEEDQSLLKSLDSIISS